MRANLVDLVGFLAVLAVPLLIGYFWGSESSEKAHREEMEHFHALAEAELEKYGWQRQPWDRRPDA